MTALLAGAALSAIVAAVAAGAPVAGKVPMISGTPAYQQSLTCNRGTWSADTVSFSYAWAISGGSTIASGQTLKVPASAIDYNVVCLVTARDAQGQTTPASSPPVLIAPGISTVKLTKASVSKGVVTVSGVAGSALARTRGPNGFSTVVLDRLISGRQYAQIGAPRVVRSKNGAFTLSGRDIKGRHLYVVNYDPSQGSDYAPSRATRKLTVH
ncbi:MAG: hypothetical protein ACRDPM_10100 [Solirubrobacteraceae bacterium]